MNVAGIVYASDELIEQILNDNALQQVANVETLPGIVGHALAMPDIHWGYGFPVGGVAATDANTGVISPGGIGFDINCGVRLLATDLLKDQIKGQVDKLADELFHNLPSGVGTDGMRKLTVNEMREVMLRGSAWAIEEGYGLQEDLEVTEENGCLAGANPDAVSHKALQRGMSQLGSLGSGNHFCEVQMVDHIYDEEAASAFGIARKGQIVITIHCGSRGFGHQIAEEYIQLAEAKQKEYGFALADRCRHRRGHRPCADAVLAPDDADLSDIDDRTRLVRGKLAVRRAQPRYRAAEDRAAAATSGFLGRALHDGRCRRSVERCHFHRRSRFARHAE
jgi:tRNA-splicing ligase RtcB (3'-phosphate/5'-hydroxy nucleic acid ligase)